MSLQGELIPGRTKESPIGTTPKWTGTQSRQKTVSPRLRFALGAVASLFVVAAFDFQIFNRYFPLSEGWFTYYAQLILAGRTPYTNFHLFLLPGFPLTVAALIKLFGPKFIVLRIVGFVLALLFGLSLYTLLEGLFNPSFAAAATVTSVIYYQGAVTYIDYDFIQWVSAYAVAAAAIIARHFDRRNNEKLLHPDLLLAGAFVGLAFLNKQSDGLLVAASMLSAVSIVALLRLPRVQALGTISSFVIGIAIPLLLVLSWLGWNGAIHECLAQTFLGAVQSKGSPHTILFAWIPRLFTPARFEVLTVFGIAMFALRYRFLSRQTTPVGADLYTIPDLVFLTTCLLTTALPLVLDRSHSGSLDSTIGGAPTMMMLLRAQIRLSCIWAESEVVPIIAFSTTGILLLAGFANVVARRTTSPRLFIAASLSMALLLGCASSAEISQAGAFLGLALLLGYLFHTPSYRNLGRYVVLLASFCFVGSIVSTKLKAPYRWWGLVEPDVRQANSPVTVPLLAGFRLSESSARTIEDATKTLSDLLKPGDALFTFPSIPLFYVLTQHDPPTFGKVHWFDVAPDGIAERDAATLEKTRPRAIAWLNVPEYVWSAHEEGFREGHKSGQRAFIQALGHLISSGYQLKKSYRIPDGYSLDIWARADENESRR